MRGNLKPLTAVVTRWVSRSPIIHVAAATSDVVVDARINGNAFWPFLAYVDKYPGFAWAIVIPVASVPHINSSHEQTRQRRRLPMLCRVLTRGLTRSDDCVTQAASILKDHGIIVPRKVTTPAQLFDWARGEGYETLEAGSGRINDTAWSDYEATSGG